MILDFNKDWLFTRQGESPVAVQLPHDAMLGEARRADSPGGVNSGFFPGGKYRYEKTFSLEEAALQGQILLHFEGVYQNCAVFCNGVAVGNHRYGFTPFDVDITGAARIGENTILVTVDNTLQPNCRWYTGSGIYRPVQLILQSKAHIGSIHIRTLSIAPPEILVEVEAPGPATVEIYDGNTLLAKGEPGNIALPWAKLWSAEHPKLYTCRVTTAHDEKTVRFGIRSLDWDAPSGLRVNGQRVLLRGGCIHHDHGVLGACEFRAAEERRLRILKEQGFNALRISHHPASQITLELCDEIGLYVMNEAFDGWYTPKTYHDYARWFDSDWKQDVAAMVESSRNHPCVIMYSVGNEVSETAEEKGGRVCEELVDFVHSLDATRPVTAGINVLLNVYAKMGMGVYRDKGDYQPLPLDKVKGYKEKKTGSAFFNAMTTKLGKLMFFMSNGKKGFHACKGADTLDILGLNYASSQYDYHARHAPDRMMVGSETMVADVPYNWARVKQYPQLFGDFVWAAWDYLGESGIGDWTYHSYPGLPLFAGQGMIDSTGKPLAAMAYLQIAWGIRTQPYIGVRPLNHAGEVPDKGSWQFTNAIDSWSWDGFEGTKAVVEVYANAASVSLYRNGKKIGNKPLKNNIARFTAAYTPGTLYAEALDESGSVIGKAELTSGEKDTILSAKPEKTVIQADGQDLCYIPIEFTDPAGKLKPYVEVPVEISVSGPATLAGFGSALCKTNERFDTGRYTSYRGRVLAVLRAGMTPGTVTVQVKSAGQAPVTLEIEVQQ